MSPSQLYLNLLAERAKDCTISRAATRREITLEASVAGGLPDVDSGSPRRQLAGGERDAISPMSAES
jgi:hypothetical protein